MEFGHFCTFCILKDIVKKQKNSIFVRFCDYYLNIADHLNTAASEFVFFTDIVEEANAAKIAGMEAVILDRPGNIKQPTHEFKTIKDLLSFF